MPNQLDQFLHEISAIEQRIDQFIDAQKIPLDNLPSLQSIPSIPIIDTFRPSPSRSITPRLADNESDRLSSLLLSVKRDIQDFLLSGDLCIFFKYSKSGQKSQLEFVESILRLIGKKYFVWTQLSAQPGLITPATSDEMIHTVPVIPTSSRRIKRAFKKYPYPYVPVALSILLQYIICQPTYCLNRCSTKQFWHTRQGIPTLLSQSFSGEIVTRPP